MQTEVWKSVPQFEAEYEISNCGRVRSLKVKGGVMKQSTGKGYCKIVFKSNGRNINRQVHRLVAMAFVPNPENLPQVNHKDGNKQNNNDWNLEWSSSSDNVKHAYRTKLRIIGSHHIETARKLFAGAKNPKSKLTADEVIEIKNLKRTGWKLEDLSQRFNVSPTYISTIVNHGHWSDIKSAV
jgi:AraC-like DNA-binding protein